MPSVPRSAAERTLTGAITRNSSPSTWTRRCSRNSRTAPATVASTTSFSDPPSRWRHGLHVGEAHPQPVEPAVRSDRLVERRVGAAAGGSSSPCRARDAEHGRADPSADPARLATRTRGGPRPSRAARAARRSGLGADELPAATAPGAGIQRAGGIDGRRRRFGVSSTSRRSTLDMPSIMQWWTFVMTAKRSAPARPSTIHISHSGFERSSCCDDDATGEPLQLSLVPGPRQARVTDVVVDVEVLVVDPRRMPVDRQVSEDLAVAWDAMEPRRRRSRGCGRCRCRRRACGAVRPRRVAVPAMCMWFVGSRRSGTSCRGTRADRTRWVPWRPAYAQARRAVKIRRGPWPVGPTTPLSKVLAQPGDRV